MLVLVDFRDITTYITQTTQTYYSLIISHNPTDTQQLPLNYHCLQKTHISLYTQKVPYYMIPFIIPPQGGSSDPSHLPEPDTQGKRHEPKGLNVSTTRGVRFQGCHLHVGFVDPTRVAAQMGFSPSSGSTLVPQWPLPSLLNLTSRSAPGGLWFPSWGPNCIATPNIQVF